MGGCPDMGGMVIGVAQGRCSQRFQTRVAAKLLRRTLGRQGQTRDRRMENSARRGR